ncbi:MAG: hypothetical protein Q7S09_01135 [bacterium]|nr:hypothetical protein [bacterium]
MTPGLQEKPSASTTTLSGIVPAVPAIPSQTIETAGISCNKKDFTMALIFVADNIADPSMSRYSEELNYIKKSFSMGI